MLCRFFVGLIECLSGSWIYVMALLKLVVEAVRYPWCYMELISITLLAYFCLRRSVSTLYLGSAKLIA